jgi:hypothetical protein
MVGARIADIVRETAIQPRCSACSKPLSRNPRRRTMLCIGCFNRARNACPEFQRLRGAGLSRYFAAHPEARASAAERLRQIQEARPAGSPSRRKQGQALTRSRIGWCPPAYYERYRELLDRHRYSAAEAKALILEQIEADERRFGDLRPEARAELRLLSAMPPSLRASVLGRR